MIALYISLSVLAGAAVTYFIVRASFSSKLAKEETLRSVAEQQVVDLRGSVDALTGELGELRHAETEARTTIARLETEHETALKQLEERTLFLEKAEAMLSKTFSELSGKALQGAQTQFLEMAQQGFKSQRETSQLEMDKRKEAVEALVKPVAETLDKLQENLNVLETTREGAYQALREQVGAIIQSQTGLQKETSRLVQALRTPTGRGQWGELQLKKVVEMAGMVEHCDFVTQETHASDEGGRLRPDLIVRLPGGRSIVIDSKSPMDAYLRAMETEDESERREHLAHHARQVRTHLVQLGSKDYWSRVEGSPEFVVLFLPSEAFFQAALEADSSLIQCGVDKNVILATPTTLIALLRAVAYGWRQEQLADNARKISEAGKELYDRCTVMGSHFATLGKSIQKSVETYNKTVASFETRVLTGARNLKNLGVSGKSDLPELSEINTMARQPRSLTSSEAESGKDDQE